MSIFNLTVAKRLWFLVTVALSALAMVGLSGLYISRDLSARLNEVNENTMPSIKSLLEVQNAFGEMQGALMLHFSYLTEGSVASADKRIVEAKKKVEQALSEYEKRTNNPADKDMLAADREALKKFNVVFDDAWQQSQDNSKASARETLIEKGSPLAQVMTAALAKHVAYNVKLAEEGKLQAQQASKNGALLSGGLMVAAVVAVGLMSLLLIRKISGDLAKMRDTIRKIDSDLDFTLRVDVNTQDELGSTSRAMNRLLDKVDESLRSLAGAAGAVMQSAQSLTNTADEVATAAATQSESASTMAASVEELTVSIGHVGDRATEANHLAIESGALATTGEKVIGQTVQDIKDIAEAVDTSSERIRQLEEQSQRISKVVQVIKEVADQTNLLALNAAIEAARAGEQGRGFAVVADEVRKLAERTSSSTQEISSTIDAMSNSARLAVDSMKNAVARVSAGVSRASDANHSIQQIGAGSQRTVAMVDEITNAIREQSQASTQIAQMVESIAQMADTSTASAQNGASSAHQLNELATQMQQIIAAYKL